MNESEYNELKKLRIENALSDTSAIRMTSSDLANAIMDALRL